MVNNVEAKSRFSKVNVDAFWILMNYGLSAASGMLFWVFAARMLLPESLGVETGVLSIVTAAAAMAAVGTGNAALATMPASGSAARLLLNYALRHVLVLSLITGLGAGVLVAIFLPVSLPAPLTVTLIAAGTVAWSLFVFKDPTFAAFGHVRDAASVNGISNLIKLGLLVLFGLVLTSVPSPLLTSSFIPLLGALGFWFFILLPRFLKGTKMQVAGDVKPPQTEIEANEWFAKNRTRFSQFSKRDSISTSLNLGVGLSLSFIVTATAGPHLGAVFAICYQVSAILDLVVVGTSGSLILNNTSGHIDARKLALGMWVKTFALVGVVGLMVALFSPMLLNFLNPFYVENGGIPVLVLLMAGAALRTAYEVWSSLMRAQHRVGTLLKWNVFFGVALLLGTISGSLAFGAVGCAAAVFAVTVIQFGVGLVGILHSKKVAA